MDNIFFHLHTTDKRSNLKSEREKYALDESAYGRDNGNAVAEPSDKTSVVSTILEILIEMISAVIG